jgi:hypothetical protein
MTQQRVRLDSLAEDVADMTSTLVRMGETLGWEHPLVALKCAQLELWEKELASQREARRVAVQQPRLVG